MLDVDRYPINGNDRDMVIAVRELNQAGLPDSQRNWANDHTVYTHGYGVIAAYGNQRDTNNQPDTNTTASRLGGAGHAADGLLSDSAPERLPAADLLRREQPVVLHRRQGARRQDVELDIPEAGAPGREDQHLHGTAGVPVGGLFNKLLYAVKFGEPNIVLSERVNENSQDPLQPLARASGSRRSRPG